MKKEMICISCPIGCGMTVEMDDAGQVLSVTGNTCKRGEKYAIDECTNPVRMLTTTIRVHGGALPMIPVKTASPIPKDKMMECMQVINRMELDAPIRMGEVIIGNICDTGVDIIATNEL